MLDAPGPNQQLHKVLVMSDDQQLEVTLLRASPDDPGEDRGDRSGEDSRSSLNNATDEATTL